MESYTRRCLTSGGLSSHDTTARLGQYVACQAGSSVAVRDTKRIHFLDRERTVTFNRSVMHRATD